MGNQGYGWMRKRIRVRIRFNCCSVYSFNYYWSMFRKQWWIRRRLLTLSIYPVVTAEKTADQLLSVVFFWLSLR